MFKAAPQVRRTFLFWIIDWPQPTFSRSPPFLSISSASPAQFLSSYCSFFPSASHLSLSFVFSFILSSPPALSYLSLPSLSVSQGWIVKVADTYRSLCNWGDKEGSILKAFHVRHPWRGEASFSMFTSSGQFITPQLLFGNACRQWRESETGRTEMLHVFCWNTFNRLTEDSSGQLRALNSEQAQVRLHGARPGTEWGLARIRDTMTLKEINLFSQWPQCLLLNIENPFLEQLCDEAQYIILRNQIKFKRPPASLRYAAQHLAGAINECRLMPSPNGIALSWSSLLWHRLSSGEKITRKIKRQNEPEAAHHRQPGPQITH